MSFTHISPTLILGSFIFYEFFNPFLPSPEPTAVAAQSAPRTTNSSPGTAILTPANAFHLATGGKQNKKKLQPLRFHRRPSCGRMRGHSRRVHPAPVLLQPCLLHRQRRRASGSRGIGKLTFLVAQKRQNLIHLNSHLMKFNRIICLDIA